MLQSEHSSTRDVNNDDTIGSEDEMVRIVFIFIVFNANPSIPILFHFKPDVMYTIAPSTL